MKYILAISLSYLPLIVLAQDELNDASAQQAPTSLVKPNIITRSIFPDKIAYATIHFDTLVAQPYLDPIENDTCKILNIETYEPEGIENVKSAARIQFQVKQPGIAILPTIPFESETKRYKTQPVQFISSSLTRSDDLSLTIIPTKTEVYTSEPVRFDLTWNCNIHAPALQNLILNPSFFNNKNIEVAIPRNNQAEDKQVGLPIGGRRVIATREINPNHPKNLGKITLPIYLRFNQPGTIRIPSTTLEISKLLTPKGSFAQFVAHFNNSFFTPNEEDQIYNRLYTTSQPHTIKVLPLPNSPLAENFTGIFSPAHINLQIKPSNTVEIGQILELDLKLTSTTPTSFLELPKLSEQANLDERFLITDNYQRKWHPEGTSFKHNLRILNTTIQDLPPLDFNIFNTDTGQFEVITTPSIPLTVKPHKNQHTIALKNLSATQTLTSNPEGIWHNHPLTPMNNYFQQLLHAINTHFWILLALIPIVSILAIPFILKARKRALNASYKLQEQSYKAFRKASENSPEKWHTFLTWLASHFQVNDKSWTFSDTEKALKQINASEEDLSKLAEIHKQQDESTFANTKQKTNYVELTTISKRISKLLPLILVTSFALCSQSLKASEWKDAQASFQQAQETSNPQLYSQAALLYEIVAKQNKQPATAWYNSGNAWFHAGELGRSIVAYRQAQTLSPWNQEIKANLISARSLVATEVPLTQNTWERIPLITLKFTTLGSLIILSLLSIYFIRYRKRTLYKSSITFAVLFISLLTTTSIKIAQQRPQGVIITNKVNSKKGPSYAYANAFDNSLRDGLEFSLLETRNNWHHIQLHDKRQCWIPATQAELIE